MLVIITRSVTKLVARLLTTAALWVRIQTPLKSEHWATYGKRRSDQHTLARQKIFLKNNYAGLRTCNDFLSPFVYPDLQSRIQILH